MSSSPISHSYGTRQAGARRAGAPVERSGAPDLGAELPQVERGGVQGVPEAAQDLRVGVEGEGSLEGVGGAEDGGEENSDRDEALDDRSRGSSAATDGGAPAFDFTSARLLDAEHCRTGILITTRGGIRIPCVCGKKVEDCRQHAPQRRRGESPFPVGYYMPMTDRTSGFRGHGIRDQYCSRDQYKAHKDAADAEMANLVRGQESGGPRGIFAGGGRGVRWEEEEIVFEHLDDGTDENHGGRRASGASTSAEESAHPEFFGVQLHSGARFVAQDPDDFQELLPEDAPIRFQITFNSRREAREWHRTGSLGRPKASANEAKLSTVADRGLAEMKRRSHGDPGGFRQGFTRSGIGPPARGADPQRTRSPRTTGGHDSPPAARQAASGSRTTSSRGPARSSSTYGAVQHSDGRGSAGRTQNGLGSGGGPGAGDSSSSSSSSTSGTSRGGGVSPHLSSRGYDSASGDDSLSDDSSVSSSGSSGSGGRRHASKRSGSRHRRSRRRSSSRSQKRRSSGRSHRRSHGRRPKGRSKVFDGTDESVGDPARAFGMDIEGRKIDAALAPPDLSPKDYDSLYDTALDVASLPGTLKSSTYKPPEGLTMDGLGSLVNSWTAGRTKYTAFKTAWDSEHNHGLGRVTDKSTLLKAAQKLHDDRKDNLKPTTQRVNILLLERNYSSSAVKRYQRYGGIPTLARLSYAAYSGLLATLRQRAIDFPDWATGPAKEMLEHHSTKLAQIRATAVNRKSLVLNTYVYLRDAEASDYTSTTMYRSMWESMTEVRNQCFALGVALEEARESGGKKGKPDGDGGGSKQCSHCRSRKLHELLGVGIGRATCPFGELKSAQARKAAGVAMAAHEKEGGKLVDHVKKALDEHNTP